MVQCCATAMQAAVTAPISWDVGSPVSKAAPAYRSDHCADSGDLRSASSSMAVAALSSAVEPVAELNALDSFGGQGRTRVHRRITSAACDRRWDLCHQGPRGIRRPPASDVPAATSRSVGSPAMIGASVSMTLTSLTEIAPRHGRPQFQNAGGVPRLPCSIRLE
jgi:hypothetical protein